MRCLRLVLLAPLATAWVVTRPTRRPTNLAAKKKSRKLERLQELKEVSGAELDATEQWAANLESRLDAAMDDGDRDEKASKVLELCKEENRDFDAIDAAVKDLAALPAYPDIGFRARGDWRLVWAKSDEGVGFIGTGLHRVPLANLEDQFLSLEADGSCALTEVIRVIGPFPNVKNLLTGTSTVGPSTLRLTYTKVIDGTGAELTSSQARSVKLRLAALSKSLLVVAAASIDADDWLVFEREDDFADALERLRVPPNTPEDEEEDSGGFKMPKMPWDKKSSIMNSFQSEVESASDVFQREGLARYQLKKREEKQFEFALRQLRAKYANESIDLVTKFGRIKKKTLKSLALKQNIESYDLDPLRVALRKLISLLKDLEMRQVEQCEELIGEFETKYFEVKQSCLEGQQAYFRRLEDHETNFIRMLSLLVGELLDQAAKDKLPDDLPSEISSLLTDRDSCMNAITGSHDIHVGKLYRREDEAKHNEGLLFKGTLRYYRDEEHLRSRCRISELNDFEGACLNEFSRLTSDRDSDEKAE